MEAEPRPLLVETEPRRDELRELIKDNLAQRGWGQRRVVRSSDHQVQANEGQRWDGGWPSDGHAMSQLGKALLFGKTVCGEEWKGRGAWLLGRGPGDRRIFLDSRRCTCSTLFSRSPSCCAA